MQKGLLVSVTLLLVSCSAQMSKEEAHRPPVTVSQESDSPQLVTTLSDSLENNGEIDTIGISPEIIAAQLERARQHYVEALGAQDVGDSTQSELEFEAAIQILNELSYYPGVDSIKDFADLSQSIIEDYEKYIALIDDVGPDASVFALREKLNQFVESQEVLPTDIPRDEIRGTVVPLPYNDLVERNILFFTGRGREHFERWMFLSGRYFPMMRRIFREESVPEELIYLSMMESGLRNDARSWAKAVGIWQFVKGTGNLYGLKGNWWFDERRDFEKATRAAARHLKDLHAEFGDWYLSLGAYNAGAGRIYGAIRRSGSTDYWELRRYLPRETRNYIPQYIAVARMAMNPEQHGFRSLQYADSLSYDVVIIDDCVDLSILGECAETDVATLRSLNPELLQACTPPGVAGYRLRIPIGTKEAFSQKFALVPDDQKRDWMVHKVKKGETLSTIAKKYGIEMSLIREINTLRSMRLLSVGQTLTIPVPAHAMVQKQALEYEREHVPVSFRRGRTSARATADRSKVAARSKPQKPSNRERLTYFVKRGDTMGHIAEWYGVRASDIRNWNDIPYGSHIFPGQELEIWVPPARTSQLRRLNEMTFAQKQALLKGAGANGERREEGITPTDSGRILHTVKSGETLERIARNYGITIAELKQWNGLKSNRIYTGQKLEIQSDGSSPVSSK